MLTHIDVLPARSRLPAVALLGVAVVSLLAGCATRAPVPVPGPQDQAPVAIGDDEEHGREAKSLLIVDRERIAFDSTIREDNGFCNRAALPDDQRQPAVNQ